MYHMYQIAVKLGYDSPRTRIMALEATNATKSFQLDVERFIVDFILGEKKKNGIEKSIIVEFAFNFS